MHIDLSQMEMVQCPYCGHQDLNLSNHLLEAHGVSLDLLLKEDPNFQWCSPDLFTAFEDSLPRANRSHPSEDLKIKIYSHELSVNNDVEELDCLKVPTSYRYPKYGKLHKDVRGALVSFLCGRSMYVWGLPGSGKDALFHAICGMLRRPSALYQIQPGIDVTALLEVRSFSESGTFWEEGPLLKMLRDGYTSPISGRKLPYVILLTDLDRCDASQLEALRMILDSTQGRIQTPSGRLYNVFPGTQVVATGNSMGAGDTRGRCTSAQVLDASIMDRFDFIREFHWMDWRDEGSIIQEKFPLLNEQCPKFIDRLGKCVELIRKDIKEEVVLCEMSHRAVCSWAGYAEDLIRVWGKVPSDLYKEASRSYLDQLPDPDTRLHVKRLIDPHMKGGAVSNTDASFQEGELDSIPI